MTLALVGAAFAAGLALGCWWKGNDKEWNRALMELEREIAQDALAEAREYKRAEQTKLIRQNAFEATRKEIE
jgi:hypothetical protein